MDGRGRPRRELAVENNAGSGCGGAGVRAAVAVIASEAKQSLLCPLCESLNRYDAARRAAAGYFLLLVQEKVAK